MTIITVDTVGARNKPDTADFLAALSGPNINLNSVDDFEMTIVGDGLDSDVTVSRRLTEQLAQPNIKVSVIWINHNKSVPCQLNSLSSFADLHQLPLFST